MKLFKTVWLNLLLSCSVVVQATPITFIAPTQITAGAFTITTTGYYQLLDDTTFSGANGTNAIAITSDNVTLDLNGKHLISGNANTTNAINITAPVKNVIIQNGTISNFVTTSVKVDTATSYTNIVLSDLFINGGTGSSTSGISYTNVFNGLIQRCTVTRDLIGGNFTTCNNITLLDSIFSHCFNRNMSATSCNNFYFSNCRMNNNTFTNAIGALVSSCQSFTFANCFFHQSVSNSSAIAARGASVLGSREINFYNCEFCKCFNTAPAGPAYGLEIDGSTGVYVKDSIFANNGNVGTGACSGIRFVNAAHGNVVENCIAADNRSGTTGATAGFDLVATSSNNVFISCKAIRNAAGTTGTSRGFSLASTVTGNVLRLCQAYNNSGGGANTGFFDGNATIGTNKYYGCVAAKNGTNFSASIPFSTWTFGPNTFATAVTNLPETYYNVAVVA